jgi:hypothetical protein
MYGRTGTDNLMCLCLCVCLFVCLSFSLSIILFVFLYIISSVYLLCLLVTLSFSPLSSHPSTTHPSSLSNPHPLSPLLSTSPPGSGPIPSLDPPSPRLTQLLHALSTESCSWRGGRNRGQEGGPHTVILCSI